jgi:hypothetical protein
VRAEAIDDAINVALELGKPGCPASRRGRGGRLRA